MKIYTRGGDRGETGLFGGDRVRKDDPRVAAYGAVDELNAAIGLALALEDVERSGDRERSPGLLDRGELETVQEDLFVVGARLAAARPQRAIRRGSIPELAAERATRLEEWIDRLDEELPALDAFVLPGGHPVGAQLHLARTVCRRAEREIVVLADGQPDLTERVLPYMNRLSDLLFVLARAVNRRADAAERRWVPQRERRRAGAAEENG